MKVKDVHIYDQDIPEEFIWDCIDSPRLAYVATIISKRIKFDLAVKPRNYVPGLRMALNIIAEEAEI